MLLGSLLFSGTAMAESKTATHSSTIYLGRDDKGIPETRSFSGPAGVPSSAVISKVRIEITGQKYSAETGPSATATYLSVKVNNVAQTFSFNLGETTTVGKDYLVVAGLASSFNVQVTGYGEMFQITPAFMGGLMGQSDTGIFSLKVIVTYSALYTVTWMNGDVILETDGNLPYLTMPSYDGALPSRAADAQYTYQFSGWEPAVAAVTEDVTYQAAYDKTVNGYTITWKNGDTVLETDQDVPYGTIPDYNGPTPAKELTDQYMYLFSGWEPAVSAVTGVATYEAVFTQTGRPYTITFDSTGGSTVTPVTQGYGTPVSAPIDPTREGYTFKGWNPAVPEAMPAGNLTCAAQWQANQYEITFNSAGGSPVASIYTDYNAAIILPPPPARTGYTFDGWTPELPETMPARNLACTAMWLRNMYSVQYLPGSQGTFPIYFQYLYFNAAIPSIGFDVTGNPGYVFDGWDPALPAKMPGANTVHTAQWLKEGNLGSTPGAEYTITFDSAGGSPVSPFISDAGTPLTAPEPPIRDGYVFVGWVPAVPSIMPETDLTCVAQWEPKVIHYPNNTLCAQGLRLRDIAPERTSNWQMFTPLDLSKDGEQTIPLIASNLYYAGEAKVTVENGHVTVAYSVLPGVEVKSEFVAILPNLASATTTDPADLQEFSFSFGQPINIEKSLGGDTRVLLYIINVVDYHDGIPGLRLFTDRNPMYLEAVDAYQEIMD